MSALDGLARFLKTEGAQLPIDSLHYRKRIRVRGELITSPVLPTALNSAYWLSYVMSIRSVREAQTQAEKPMEEVKA